MFFFEGWNVNSAAFLGIFLSYFLWWVKEISPAYALTLRTCRKANWIHGGSTPLAGTIMADKGKIMTYKKFDLNIKLNKESESYRQMTAAGFIIESFFVSKQTTRYGYAITCDFKCVCGQKERAGPIFITSEHVERFGREYIEEYYSDFARVLKDNGAFSAKHLRKDGYSEEEISEIVKHFE